MADLIQTVLIYALPVLFAITLHEAAHAYMAYRLGDNTAWALGRVSLNPMVHIDWIGTVAVPLLLYFSSQGEFLFGYAKPVPVHFGRLHHPKRDMLWVALAGPGANFFQALIWGALYFLLIASGIDERFFLAMAKAGVLTNVVMCVFNLFPLPPMDGRRILVSLLPGRWAYALSRVEPWGFFIVLGLVLIGVVNTWWMQPLMKVSYQAISWLLTPLRMLAGT